MSTKTLLLPLLFLGLTAGAYAQERSFGTLPLGQKPGATFARDGANLKNTPEYAHALGIFNRLVGARGDSRYPVPTFAMRVGGGQAAAINYDKPEIVLEKQAYDVCASYGDQADAALAFLLGHELTHYYENHAWRRGFVNSYRDLPIAIKLDTLLDAAANETEADYLGGFLAYSAGFGLFDQGGDFIKSIYDAYEFDPEIPGYPSLSDRMALGARTAEKLTELVDVFDMANLLVAIGNYSQAYEHYRYIIMRYQSREFYNNLGVTATLDALQYFNPNELKFRFPLELDLQTSASKGDGAASDRNKLLRQAILHFDAAISLDPRYAPAYLNKASVFALLGDNERARFYADKEARQAAIENDAFPKTAVDVDILLGILDSRERKTEQADTAFATAAKAGSALAAHNLKILRGEPIGTEKTTFRGSLRPEKIDEQTILNVAFNFIADSRMSINLTPQYTLYYNSKQGENSRLLLSYDEYQGKGVYVHLTGPDYQGATGREIKLGDARDAIIEAYGEPQRTLETPRGEILKYNSMIFILGPEGKLERWANHIER
jgi:hypothetical protein